MSICFVAEDKWMALARKVMTDCHPELVRAKVELGVTFALSAKESQPALKEHGQATFGLTKIIAAKDRIRKGIDVELWLDGDEWGTDSDDVRWAKIDHLLQRIEVKKPKPKKNKKKKAAHGTDEENQQHEEAEFLLDAGGRAVLKFRKPDLFTVGGYREVIERNGQNAPECIILEAARYVADAACEVCRREEEAAAAENEARREAAEAQPAQEADEAGTPELVGSTTLGYGAVMDPTVPPDTGDEY